MAPMRPYLAMSLIKARSTRLLFRIGGFARVVLGAVGGVGGATGGALGEDGLLEFLLGHLGMLAGESDQGLLVIEGHLRRSRGAESGGLRGGRGRCTRRRRRSRFTAADGGRGELISALGDLT